jgi:hypothetical protein
MVDNIIKYNNTNCFSVKPQISKKKKSSVTLIKILNTTTVK